MLISPAVRKVEGSLPSIYDLATGDYLRYPSPSPWVSRSTQVWLIRASNDTTFTSPVTGDAIYDLRPQKVGIFYIVPYDPLLTNVWATIAKSTILAKPADYCHDEMPSPQSERVG